MRQGPGCHQRISSRWGEKAGDGRPAAEVRPGVHSMARKALVSSVFSVKIQGALRACGMRSGACSSVYGSHSAWRSFQNRFWYSFCGAVKTG